MSFYLYMDEIESRLFLGSEEACETHLEDAKITHVLSLREPEVAKRDLPSRITHSHIVIEDDESENILQYLRLTHRWIQSALGTSPHTRVLVHCRAGISRSATIVVHHLMQMHGIADDVALERVRRKREVDPNLGFRWQLRVQALQPGLPLDPHPQLSTILIALPSCLLATDRYLVSIVLACLFAI